MIIVISPAKKLDFKSGLKETSYTIPENKVIAEKIVHAIRKLSADEIGKLMNLSANLANLNRERYLNWQFPTQPDAHTRQALFAFKGDVYQGLKPETLSNHALDFLQNNLRILSGLHGLLRPLDVIQPYRLEMGSKISIDNSKNLYEVWSQLITKQLNSLAKENQTQMLVNLASNEYFKAIDTKNTNLRIITPVFKDYKNGSYKIISFFAKKARGMMTRFIAENALAEPEKLKLFDDGGYYYNDALSKQDEIVFTRG
jgi:hypothetical protein